MNIFDFVYKNGNDRLNEAMPSNVNMALNAIENANLGQVDKLPAGKRWILVDWAEKDVLYFSDKELIEYGQQAYENLGLGENKSKVK